MPLSPFGLLAVHVKITVPTGCSITRLMSVTVTTGLTPVQFEFGHPASAAVTVAGALSVFAMLKARLPFLILSAGIRTGVTDGPMRTLFCPGAVLPPPFWH